MPSSGSSGFTLVIPVFGGGTAILTNATDVGVIPGGPVGVTLDDFWRPGVVGNGRMWVSGRVHPDSQPVTSIDYTVNDILVRGTTPYLAGETFGFYIMGTESSPWGTFRPQVSSWQTVTNADPTKVYYQSPYANSPIHLRADGNIAIRTEELMADAPFNSWTYIPSPYGAGVGGLVQFKPNGFAPPDDSVEFLTDPVFAEGQDYTVTIIVNGSDDATPSAIFDMEQFRWNLPVRDYVTRYMRVMFPSYLSESEFGRSLYLMYAKQWADLISQYEDCINQYFSQRATWGLGIWENLLGIPRTSGQTYALRRSAVLGYRNLNGSKEAFFNDLGKITGTNYTISELYSTQHIDIRLTASAANPATRNLALAYVRKRKPAGIEVSVSFGGFIVGESLVGDPL